MIQFQETLIVLTRIILALLSHQNSRMEKLMEDLNMAGQRVTQLKGEVTELERNVIERKRKRKSTFPSVSTMKEDEILKLFFFGSLYCT